MNSNAVGGRMRRPEFKKKLTTLIVSALILILNDILDLGVKTETLTWLAGLAGTYMLGQGLADVGKERAIVQGETGIADSVDIDIDMDEQRSQPDTVGDLQARLRQVTKRSADPSPFDGRAFG